MVRQLCCRWPSCTSAAIHTWYGLRYCPMPSCVAAAGLSELPQSGDTILLQVLMIGACLDQVRLCAQLSHQPDAHDVLGATRPMQCPTCR